MTRPPFQPNNHHAHPHYNRNHVSRNNRYHNIPYAHLMTSPAMLQQFARPPMVCRPQPPLQLFTQTRIPQQWVPRPPPPQTRAPDLELSLALPASALQQQMPIGSASSLASVHKGKRLASTMDLSLFATHLTKKLTTTLQNLVDQHALTEEELKNMELQVQLDQGTPLRIPLLPWTTPPQTPSSNSSLPIKKKQDHVVPDIDLPYITEKELKMEREFWMQQIHSIESEKNQGILMDLISLKVVETVYLPEMSDKRSLIYWPEDVQKIAICIKYYPYQHRYEALLLPTIPQEMLENRRQQVINEKSTKASRLMNAVGTDQDFDNAIMSLLFWNCRGAGSRHFLNNLRQMLSWTKPSILTLTETKKYQHDELMEFLGFDAYVEVSTFGLSGGMMIFWKTAEVTIVRAEGTSSQEIHVIAKVGNLTPFRISVIHASTNYNTRLESWETLKHINLNRPIPWVICGDFNEVLGANEKFGGNPVSLNRISAFLNCIDNIGLIDLGFSRPRFTWTNKHKKKHTIIYERLDRFLCTNEWLKLFPHASVKHLPHIHLDHCPLLLDWNRKVAGTNIFFKFETMWMSSPDFHSIVNSTWHDLNTYNQSLKQFIPLAKNWSKSSFGNVFKNKRNVLARINGLQEMNPNFKSDFHLELEGKLQAQYNTILSAEDEYWKL